MHPRVQWVCSDSGCVCVCVYVCMREREREWARMGEQVCENVCPHTCVNQGMTNEISSPDIHYHKNTHMSLRGAAVSISMLISTHVTYSTRQLRWHNWRRARTDGKTSRDASITKSITIDHSVKIRAHKGVRIWDKGIFCIKHAENIGVICKIGISSHAITG